MSFIDERMIYDENGKRLSDKIGVLSDLQTQNKDSLVGAVNEHATQLADKSQEIEHLNGITGVSIESFPLIAPEVDDTQRIQRAVDSLLDKSILIFPIGGIYTISTYINLTKPISIYGHGAKITLSSDFKSGSMGQGFFYANNVSYITLNGLTLDGNKDNLAADATNNFGVWFDSCAYATVQDCRVVNLNGHGNNLNTVFGFVGSSSIYAKAIGNTLENCGGGGIFFQGTHCIAMANICISLEDVALVANSSGCSNVSFIGNTIKNVSSGAIGIENGASSIVIIGNTIKNITDGYGIAVLNIGVNVIANSINIQGNVIDGNSGSNPCNGIIIAGKAARNVNIQGNIIKNLNQNNQGNNAITISANNNNIVISENQAFGIQRCGILIYGANDITVSNNKIKAGANGIYLQYLDANTMTNINISNNTVIAYAGIYADNSSIKAKLINNKVMTPSTWSSSVEYLVGDIINANGNVYIATISGTSGQTAPDHSSGTATDGTVTWQYLFPYTTPKRYSIGSIGKSKNFTIVDPDFDEVNQYNNLTKYGVIDFSSSPVSIASGSYYEIIVNTLSSYDSTVSGGYMSVDNQVLYANFNRWANNGLTAVFRVYNPTSSSQTLNKAFYHIFGGGGSSFLV